MNILWFDTPSIKTAANNLKNQEINSNLGVIDSLVGYTPNLQALQTTFIRIKLRATGLSSH